jgi:hypothetical protein
MKQLITRRRVGMLLVSVIALVAIVVATANAVNDNTVGPAKSLVFAFQWARNSPSKQLFNVDGLSVNARCDSQGGPVIFAFTSLSHADLLGHMLDGSGRTHIIANDSFTKNSRGVSLAPNTSGDRDAAGTVIYGTSDGRALTVNYAFDNSRTMAGLNVCVVYGTLVGT